GRGARLRAADSTPRSRVGGGPWGGRAAARAERRVGRAPARGSLRHRRRRRGRALGEARARAPEPDLGAPGASRARVPDHESGPARRLSMDHRRAAGGARDRAAMSWGALGLTALALVAFAANSVLCRMALGADLIDPVAFTQLRLISGALALAPFLLARRAHITPLRADDAWPAVALFAYAIA